MPSPNPTALPRVLFVNHASRMGGAELILLDVVRGFAGRSSVWLFEDGPLRTALEALGLATMLPADGRDLTGIKRDRSLLRALPMLGNLVSMCRAIARAARGHDLIYANSQKAFVLASIASALARRPLIWHLHDILSAEHFGRSQLVLTKWLANRFATRIIVPSTACAEAFAAAGGRAALVTVVANGVTFEPRPADRASLRVELGLPTGFVFGVFSRLAPWKGQRVAIEALARLPNATCLIVGSALFGEDDYAATLKALAQTLGVAARVQFLGQRDDVPALMQAVDAVVHPSTAPEPFGRTLVEAMLAGTPVVATTGGAAGDILNDGAAGILVPPGDAGALADALEGLRADPGAAAAMIARAERRAREVFSAARMQAAIEAVTREVGRRAGAH